MEGGCGKYLGLPEQFGRTKRDLFTNIVDKIHQKRINWSTKFLSQAGKDVMLKSVLSSMPTYATSCFLLPKSLCKRIQSEFTRFWWDQKLDKKGMDWIAWKKLIQSKDRGGLGFREIKTFNLALVAKVSWRILKNPNSLLSKLLLAKYCKYEDFINCTKRPSDSHAWKGIMLGRDLLRQNMGWIVGNGKKISVWNDNWLSPIHRKAPFGPVENKYLSLKVADLISTQDKNWNQVKVDQILPSYAKEIRCIKLSSNLPEDKRIWLGHPNGEYSVKTGYYAGLEAGLDDGRIQHRNQHTSQIDWKKAVWNLKIPPKIKLFVWKTLHEAIPVGSLLRKRQIEVDTACKLCGEEESITHIFWNCPHAQNIWKTAPLNLEAREWNLLSFPQLWRKLISTKCLPPTGIVETPLPAWIIWRIWKTRNNLVFNNLTSSDQDSLSTAIQSAKEWEENQNHNRSKKSMERRYPPKPNPELMTMYVDAAWNDELKVAGTAYIIKLSREHSITSSAALEDIRSPLMAEACAMKLGLEKALELGVRRLQVFTDSQILANAIIRSMPISEIFGVQYDLTISLSQFSKIEVHFISRDLNQVADGVAKASLQTFIRTMFV